MSTILKALRRLEHEKATADRPLREQVTGADGDDGDDGGESPPRRRWPILVGGVVAGVAAGLAVLFAMRHEASSPVASGSAPAVAEAAAPPRAGRGQLAPIQPKRAPAAVAARPPAPAPAPIEVEDVAVVPREPVRPRLAADESVLPPDDEELAGAGPAPEASAPSPAPAARAAPAPTPVPARTLTPVAPAPAAVPAQAASAPRAAAQPVAPQSAPAPTARAVAAKPAAAPKPPVAAVTPTEKPAPAVAKAAAPSAKAKRSTAPDDFPELRVERTLWHPLPDRRTAVIEVSGRSPAEFHEGAEVVPGTRIALIEPSGVVFRFEGKDVRRKIGEEP